jgi:hypothetical protein
VKVLFCFLFPLRRKKTDGTLTVAGFVVISGLRFVNFAFFGLSSALDSQLDVVEWF